jgi:hypothetical protein
LRAAPRVCGTSTAKNAVSRQLPAVLNRINVDVRGNTASTNDLERF